MTCENISGYHLIVVEGLQTVAAQHQALELTHRWGSAGQPNIRGNLDEAATLSL